MAEHVFTGQTNLGMVTTIRMSKPAPAIANRIFDKKGDVEAFIGQAQTSAVPGLLMSVINDGALNGVYQVVNDSKLPNGLGLNRLGEDAVVKVTSYIKGAVNTESSSSDYVNISVGKSSSKLFTISTDMLRNGSMTLVLDGHF